MKSYQYTLLAALALLALSVNAQDETTEAEPATPESNFDELPQEEFVQSKYPRSHNLCKSL